MRILSFATYPVGTPRHGGQIRVAAIQQMLREQGHQVRHVAAHHPSWYGDVEAPQPHDIVFDDAFMNTVSQNQWRPDVHASAFVWSHSAVVDQLSADIEAFDPDIVMFEQPWLWPALKPILASLATSPVVVYSSQNVEARLIGQVLGDLPPERAAEVIDETDLIEMDLVREADLVIAVSEDDAERFRAAAKRIIVAGNGVWPPVPPGGLEFWKNHTRGNRFAVFIGSAHMPNLYGFEKMLGYDLSFLKPDQLIVAVGGVSALLEAKFRRVALGGVAWARTLIAGSQDSGGLSSIRSLAAVFLLPITEGGGTNLKTAEALYSRRPILATSFAFRGYEAYTQFPNVRIHDDPVEYRAALAEMLSSEAPSIDHSWEQLEQLEKLLWPETLRTITTTLGIMHAQREQARRLDGGLGLKSKRNGRVAPAVAALSGFHPVDEDESIWSGVPLAVLKLPVDARDEHWAVEIRFRLMPDQDDKNEVRFYTLSGLQHRYSLGSPDFQTVEFSCSTEDLVGDELEIYVETECQSSPASLGLSIDARPLGTNIASIVVK